MKKENAIVFKPNELIEVVNRPISSMGLKAYNLILQKLQKANTDRMVISPSDIDLEGSRNYDELYAYLDELQKVQVKSIDKRGKTWGSFVLISEFKKLDEGIFVAVPPSIYNVLCGKDKKQEELYYTTIKLLEEKSFKCSYSIIFYEIFKKYEKIGIPTYTLEELKGLTKTSNKYKVYYEFKRWVLNPAIKEINKYDSNYNYSFEEIKLGRKVDSIQFIRENKDKDIIDAEIVEDIPMSDKLINAIKKAKKSLYVQSAYSQKAMEKLLKKYDEKLIIKALGEVAKYNQKIKSFSSIMTSKIEDIKNSSNKALDKKLKKGEKALSPLPKIEINQPQEKNNIGTDEVEHLKKLLHHQAKDQGKLSPIMESMIKACKSKNDVEMIANNLKIELNLELF
ncbi:replication initiation protein [Fusobacterium mortiferum]|uniref:replication initiation protein n=1 Tax=Fusobacterium mortiferum TaxID=850 RepID=UPI00195DA813|nr:replication initiation protein [Fusobacterium mortiferum]